MKKITAFWFLFVITGPIFSAKIDTLFVKSASMHKEIPNIVIVPKSYTNSKNPFPVLYLLHGAGDDYLSWLIIAPKLTAYADAYNIIIVCPDGAKTSWYFDSPVDEDFKYETYMAHELINSIDKQYRTVTNSNGRAITGLSMGGHGAFYLALRHQEVWGAAGSMSGGLDIRPFKNNWDLTLRLGLYNTNKQNWENNTVINLLYLAENKKLKLIFDCGVDDFFYECNKSVHQKMLEKKIPHEYIERPGAHTRPYWTNAIKYQLLYFNDFFEQSR